MTNGNDLLSQSEEHIYVYRLNFWYWNLGHFGELQRILLFAINRINYRDKMLKLGMLRLKKVYVRMGHRERHVFNTAKEEVFFN